MMPIGDTGLQNPMSAPRMNPLTSPIQNPMGGAIMHQNVEMLGIQVPGQDRHVHENQQMGYQEEDDYMEEEYEQGMQPYGQRAEGELPPYGARGGHYDEPVANQGATKQKFSDHDWENPKDERERTPRRNDTGAGWHNKKVKHAMLQRDNDPNLRPVVKGKGGLVKNIDNTAKCSEGGRNTGGYFTDYRANLRTFQV
jgi:hypothetical protein